MRARALARELDLPDDASRSELVSALADSRLIVASLPERVDDTGDLEYVLRLLPREGLRAGPSAGWLPVQPRIPSRQPRYTIHVKAVLCGDSDGSKAAQISEGALTQLFEGLSQVYFPVGLTFVHSTVVLHDTMINQDFTLPAGADLTSPDPPITKEQKDASFDEHNKVRSDWARENHRGSLVVFFR